MIRRLGNILFTLILLACMPVLMVLFIMRALNAERRGPL